MDDEMVTAEEEKNNDFDSLFTLDSKRSDDIKADAQPNDPADEVERKTPSVKSNGTPTDESQDKEDKRDSTPGVDVYQLTYDPERGNFELVVDKDNLAYDKAKMLRTCEQVLSDLKKKNAKSNMIGAFVQFVTTAFGLPTDFAKTEVGAEQALDLASATGNDFADE